MIDVIYLIVFAVVPAIVLHECAHGVVAYWLGDPTAKNLGRLTLNPIKHIDPLGSVIIPGAFFLMHFFGLTKSLFLFGWAKPVPVNFGRLRNPRLGIMLVAAAGPITNIFLAWLYILLYKWGVLSGVNHILAWGFLFNLTLCVFNLVPIPPLDGSKILFGVLPPQIGIPYMRLERFGFIVIIVLAQMGLLKFLWPAIAQLAFLLGVQI